MRLIILAVALVGTSAVAGSAQADPILECRVLAGDDAAVSDCLRTQLEVSYRAMNEALGLARAAAEDVDRAAGGQAAVLGLEGAQQAWEAYRDVECQTFALFAAAAQAEPAELACEIRLTRARTDALLAFGSQQRG
jgi:uncharacterized protein YecT (DUF1311 family)